MDGVRVRWKEEQAQSAIWVVNGMMAAGTETGHRVENPFERADLLRNPPYRPRSISVIRHQNADLLSERTCGEITLPNSRKS